MAGGSLGLFHRLSKTGTVISVVPVFPAVATIDTGRRRCGSNDLLFRRGWLAFEGLPGVVNVAINTVLGGLGFWFVGGFKGITIRIELELVSLVTFVDWHFQSFLSQIPSSSYLPAKAVGERREAPLWTPV